MNFKQLLKCALKEEPCDIVFKNAVIPNLYTMEYEKTEIAVKDGIIAGVGDGYSGAETVECGGMILAPGFIEGHMHIESTYMVPRSCAAAISPHGTTTAMPDPHEIANTCGTEGVRFMHEESRGLPVDFFFGAPSCVPASAAETPFAPIEADELKELLEDGSCTHLGEMMNFPGVIFGDEKVWKKLEAAEDMVITGHAPHVTGERLCAYLLGGVTSDHECDGRDEALEKLRRGMYLMIRQGTTARNLSSLAPILAERPELAVRCLAVGDDLSPLFIRERGHMDGCLRELIAEGVAPLAALRTITLTPAEYFRLHDRGAISPGKRADLVLLESLEGAKVLKVWKNGKLVAENGKMIETPAPAVTSPLPGCHRETKTPSADELRIKQPGVGARLRVIGIVPKQVFTRNLLIDPVVRDGLVCADAERGLSKICVVEKNHGTGRRALGFLKDFGLTRGAIASSIAHDAHNYVCAGMDDGSMAAALAELSRIKGGIVVADENRILAELELPVGGLMSTLSMEPLCEKFEAIAAALKEIGCTNEDAFMQMGFLSLSVIPELKLTDKGYYDISHGGNMSLFVE